MTLRLLNTHVEVTLFDEIDKQEDFVELVSALDNAREGDKITILLACPGGRCDIGQWIINAIRASKAYVIVDVIYPSHSMASLIALCGDELVLRKGAYLMYHNYSSGAAGKGDALVSGVNADNKALKVLNEICSPFLDKKEMNNITNDKDLYIFWDDKNLQERIKRHFTTKGKK